jgi:hypothetical protein
MGAVTVLLGEEREIDEEVAAVVSFRDIGAVK